MNTPSSRSVSHEPLATVACYIRKCQSILLLIAVCTHNERHESGRRESAQSGLGGEWMEGTRRLPYAVCLSVLQCGHTIITPLSLHSKFSFMLSPPRNQSLMGGVASNGGEEIGVAVFSCSLWLPLINSARVSKCSTGVTASRESTSTGKWCVEEESPPSSN